MRSAVSLSCEVTGQPAEARTGPGPVIFTVPRVLLAVHMNSLTMLRSGQEVVVKLPGSVKDGKEAHTDSVFTGHERSQRRC